MSALKQIAIAVLNSNAGIAALIAVVVAITYVVVRLLFSLIPEDKDGTDND